jgi:hypothetical protein
MCFLANSNISNELDARTNIYNPRNGCDQFRAARFENSELVKCVKLPDGGFTLAGLE